MNHAQLQPFFAESVTAYHIYRAKPVDEGLVVTLAFPAQPTTGRSWRNVLIPNGATYQHNHHFGCVHFPIHSFDERREPDQESKWFHKSLSAPSQKAYRKLVLNAWQAFGQLNIGVVEAMAIPNGIVAIIRQAEPDRLSVVEAKTSQGSHISPEKIHVLYERRCPPIAYDHLGARRLTLGFYLYEYVISVLRSTPNDLMHLPTYKFDLCALEHSMTDGKKPDVIELIRQSTAINRLDIRNQYSGRTVMEMAAQSNQGGDVIQALLEQGANVWTGKYPHDCAMAEVVRRRNPEALHLLLKADHQNTLAQWWDCHGENMCEINDFSEGKDLFRIHLAKKAAMKAIMEIQEINHTRP